MKNRRLNVLFIAIIALAAAPQAMQDAYSLVNDAQERAESEFWSIFLSYRSPEAVEAKDSVKTVLLAARGQQETGACPSERPIVRQSEKSSQPSETRARARAESRRTASEQQEEEENLADTETIEVFADNSKEVASLYSVRPVVFSEKEQKVLKAAGLHARDVEKIAGAASRASVASYAPGSEMQQIKMKQMSDMDKILRQRTRNLKERNESVYDIPSPNTVGSM